MRKIKKWWHGHGPMMRFTYFLIFLQLITVLFMWLMPHPDKTEVQNKEDVESEY